MHKLVLLPVMWYMVQHRWPNTDKADIIQQHSLSDGHHSFGAC